MYTSHGAWKSYSTTLCFARSASSHGAATTLRTCIFVTVQKRGS